ncbi:MAG: TonB-dependent receptor domain-containing protein [Acidobacteriota bacterium]
MRSFLVLALLCPALWGQGSVTIFGTVRDSSAAVVPQAEVAVRMPATGLIRKTLTDPSGVYTFSALPNGELSLEITAQGFKSYVEKGILVQVGENRRVDVRLELGSLSETIDVTAETQQVETRSGALREVVDARRIVELPLNGRNPLQLQQLVAGAGGRLAADQGQNATLSINGSRGNSNNYQLDGGDNHDPYFNSPAVFPSPDALDEFAIQTNAYGADKGRNAGAFMTAVTKSGTNQFHGALFEFLRNEKLNARNFFANNVPPFKRNQFGATLGGPLARNKSFFFFSWQRTYQRSEAAALTATVLTAPQRSGDFSSRTTALRDPTGGVFPGNRIPATRISAPARRFLDAMVPLPNRENGLLSSSSGEVQDDDQWIGKLDHNFSASHQLSGRILRNLNQRDEATGNLPGFFARIDYQNWNLSLTDTYILSPTRLNTLTFSFQKIDRRQIPIVPGNQNWKDFGAGFTRAFPGPSVASMQTQVDGYFTAFSRFPLNHLRDNLQFSDTFSWTLGRHLLKIGGDYRRSRLDLQELFRGDPFVRFQNTFTGDAAGDLLLGRPGIFEQIAETTNAPRVQELGLFLQDDWRVSSRLTLNAGARWDPWFPFTDKLNKLSRYQAGARSTVFPNAPADILFAGDPGVPASLLKTQRNNWGPRLGFAYDPTGKGRFSVRGGYGIFYSQIRQQANNQLANNQPFSLRLTVNNPAGGLESPYQGIGNPFPFTAPKTDAEKLAYRYVVPLQITQFNPNMRNALVQQWNLSLQQQLGGSVLSAAYVGSKGNHLFLTNEENPGLFGRPGALNQRRPLAPGFANLTEYSSRGNSVYHSLQLGINRRLSRGFSVLGNYTWSKLIDDSSADGDQPANPFNFRHERGRSDLDIAHRFVASYVWELPRLQARSALVRHTLGGWSTNGIVSLETGTPINFISGRDNSQSGVNQDRADLIGNPFLDTGRPRGELVQRYFNPAAFATNAPGTFGTVGRNIMSGPGLINLDFGAVKNFAITERIRLQFRGEIFNITNRVNLNNPNTNQSSPQFGLITSAGSPRVSQLALKVNF